MNYLSYADIEKLTGVRTKTLMQWKFRGKLPPPDYMPNDRTPLWKPATIEKWNRQRLRELNERVERLQKQRDRIDSTLERLSDADR